ncbi:alpha-glucan family phosphorylase [Limnochorda pilosa]|uniref:glycogen phosphorylase n=1 Tax=Limnochorda pilosa TaxID=1555112 RepID=A0A0K2SIG0_LIMPI|nr:alpha-glucan family phosphorylase [Limnochorda pilosa]BAS26624.1 alpha-glucan phosphorylase [Limnochorda pilosa]
MHADRRFRPYVAFFCMEYGLSHRFPVYSGGLGILAGDILKTARDLDLPLVGVGILWRQGYTRQVLDEHGWPHDEFPHYTPDFCDDTGVRVEVTIRGEPVSFQVWKTEAFGNNPLYLLDAGPPDGAHGWITGRLYNGHGPARIAQEMALGIGGVRALRALGEPVQLYHFNEGHAVLAATELIREKRERGLSFRAAWEATRDEVIFTTHTPVMAGNESHPLGLLEEMGAFNGLSREEMVALGGDPFTMPVAGLRVASYANGVSKMHGATARKMWEDVEGTAPILSITNGVHAGTWQDERIRRAFGEGRDLWEPHMQAKENLLAEVHRRTGHELNPERLLIGFARRAVPYKRPTLIFDRPDVTEPLLEQQTIQLVFSGKAHPEDDAGKHLVQAIWRMSQRFPRSVAFLPDYDMEIGALMTRGCDVWLNTPQRPLEASGTSGMKAALNGVLNLSVLDGWWPETVRHGVNGWQIDQGYEGPGQDHRDLLSLFQVLVDEVIPAYYEEPSRWRQMMRESVAACAGRFTSDRMLVEYLNLMYQPAAAVLQPLREPEPQHA